jgi:hypothetical protein
MKYNAINYDFFYNADGSPWFYSMSVCMMDGAKTLFHDMTPAISDEYAFTSALQKVELEGFTEGERWTNEETGTYSRSFRKYWGD